MSRGVFPSWIPCSIYIYTYPAEDEASSIVERLYHRFGGDYSEESSSLGFEHASFPCYIKCLRQGFSEILLIAYGLKGKTPSESLPLYGECDEAHQSLLIGLLPESLNSMVKMRIAYATRKERAVKLLKDHVERFEERVEGAAFIGGNLVARLSKPKETSRGVVSRVWMVIPYGGGREEAARRVWAFALDASSLAAYLGEMSSLFSKRELMFRLMDASEKSTQFRINEILAELRRPVDEIEIGGLEEILKEITIQFSRISTMVSSMRRDYVKARSLLRSLRSLVKRWREEPMEGVVGISSYEMERFEEMIAPFSDFIVRAEAMMSQLNTVLDSVRTYLGIQQQKISIAEQASSKEQLIRLVNLQEILHKLEVLIVTVYLTEMGSIVFETLFHEWAKLLTMIFIPIALFTSILLIRILHRGEMHPKPS
jgi:hypothetical protein